MISFYRNPGNLEEYSLRGQEKPEALIFTEGQAESYFMEKWLTYANKDPKKIAVICFKGNKNKLKTFFKNLMLENNFSLVSRYGFFLDAEKRPVNSTVSSIQDLLLETELIPKGSALQVGFQTIGRYQIAIYVSPNNADMGMIEHMVINEIADSNLHSCLESFKDSVEAKLGKELHPKSIVQTYMGIREPGTCGTGHGFNKTVLDVNHAAYSDLRKVMEQIL